jgi:hypothetical protein
MKINDNGVDRDMNETELAEYQEAAKVAKAEAKAYAEAQAAKAVARQAVLDKLGLSADETQALLG